MKRYVKIKYSGFMAIIYLFDYFVIIKKYKYFTYKLKHIIKIKSKYEKETIS